MLLSEAEDVLGLSARRATVPEAKAVFQRLALKAHPDKGGTRAKFMALAQAYKTVKAAIVQRDYKPPEHHEVRTAARAAAADSRTDGRRLTPAEFEAAFERERAARPDDGYGSWLAGEVDRDVLAPKVEKFEQFDTAFRKVASTVSTALIEKVKCEPFGCGTSMQETEAAEPRYDRQDDYSSATVDRGLLYTDVRLAHSGHALVCPDAAERLGEKRRETLRKALAERIQ